ncbi:hypothetical protein B0T21DRAFT_395794 [Apiosordaria backusii]|uniref:Uncharacterized protein n=1 Tax=Apiosordaria backusii TaxID=314023 RepID=A0AA40AMY2_9PEZI|nr:hypothetical protein B0T21DRAFT_395794 [Apiosordaria backusii]
MPGSRRWRRAVPRGVKGNSLLLGEKKANAPCPDSTVRTSSWERRYGTCRGPNITGEEHSERLLGIAGERRAGRGNRWDGPRSQTGGVIHLTGQDRRISGGQPMGRIALLGCMRSLRRSTAAEEKGLGFGYLLGRTKRQVKDTREERSQRSQRWEEPKRNSSVSMSPSSPRQCRPVAQRRSILRQLRATLKVVLLSRLMTSDTTSKSPPSDFCAKTSSPRRWFSSSRLAAIKAFPSIVLEAQDPLQRMAQLFQTLFKRGACLLA